MGVHQHRIVARDHAWWDGSAKIIWDDCIRNSRSCHCRNRAANTVRKQRPSSHWDLSSVATHRYYLSYQTETVDLRRLLTSGSIRQRHQQSDYRHHKDNHRCSCHLFTTHYQQQIKILHSDYRVWLLVGREVAKWQSHLLVCPLAPSMDMLVISLLLHMQFHS